MIDYDRGDVILVEITFTGVPGSKRRPAVVLSNSTFNTAGIKLIVSAITSNVDPPFRPGDVILQDWNAAGLLKPSSVRGILATVDRSDVVRLLGQLSNRDLLAVDEGTANILNYTVPGT